MDVNEFRWAVGIEDTFIGHPHPRTGRVLDEYALIDHYRRWRADLDLIAELGVGTMRYGIPWYRVEPRPGRFDWRWTDAVLEHMSGRLRIAPILDLMHYGTPTWLDGAFASPDYPARVAAYAAAVAERYRDLVSWYTPLNEPVINAVYCGEIGAWPPGMRGDRGYVSVLMALADGMSETIEAVRAFQPDAVMVHVESADWLTTDDRTLADRVTWSQTRHAMPAELVLGRVDSRHPGREWLVEHGAAVERLERLVARPQRIDVMGVNFYPHMSRGHLEQVGGVVRRRRRYARGADLSALLQHVHQRFGLPVMITETSDAARISRRAAWLETSTDALRDARAMGVPVVGYTWWPAFSLIGWNWRGGRRPLDAYWQHMGLWDIADSARLERVPTPLVEQYRGIVVGGNARVGRVSEPPASVGIRG